MITCSANLFRIAYMCASQDRTRYYLNGVQVEAHERNGVVLVATCGSKLLCIWDESGTTNESGAVIRLSDDMLKSCRTALEGQAKLVIEGHRAQLDGSNGAMVANDCRVDGVFPDWRNVVPAAAQWPKANCGFPTFQAKHISAFGEIAQQLERHWGVYQSKQANSRFQLCWSESGAPAVVLFPACETAFGVIMPTQNSAGNDRVPSWAGAKGK